MIIIASPKKGLLLLVFGFVFYFISAGVFSKGVGDEGYSYTLWAVDMDGSNLRQLIPDQWTGDFPHSRLAISSDKIALAPGDGVLKILNHHGGELKNFRLKEIYNPQWDPDGNTIVFIKYKKKLVPKVGYLICLSVPESDIYKVDVNTGKISPLARSSSSERYHNISPNGQKIAYLRDDVVWIMDRNGKNKKNLDKHVLYNYVRYKVFSWNPDSSQFTCMINENGSRTIAVYDIETDNFNHIAKVNGYDMFHEPVWSPGGKYICWSDRQGIRIYDMVSKMECITYHKEDSLIKYMIWSPDEKAIIFGDSNGIMKIELYSSIIIPIIDSPDYKLQSISRDGTQIFCIKTDTEGKEMNSERYLGL